jgi:hypothetical protein
MIREVVPETCFHAYFQYYYFHPMQIRIGSVSLGATIKISLPVDTYGALFTVFAGGGSIGGGVGLAVVNVSLSQPVIQKIIMQIINNCFI